MIAPQGSLVQQRAAQAGFTYVWLLLIIALMGMASVSVLELHQTTVRRDKEKQLLWIGRQYVSALESYRNSSRSEGTASQGVSSLKPFDPRQYPSTLEELLKDSRFGGTKRHLRTIYTDPMTGKSEWGLVRRENRIVAVYSPSAQKPIKQAGFELDQQGFQGAEHYSSWVFAPPLWAQPAIPAAGTHTSP